MTAHKHVLMLGTFHFTSKLDWISHDVDDMRSPRRQAELAVLTAGLAEYRPTKVLLELPYADADAINADRQRAGRHHAQVVGEGLETNPPGATVDRAHRGRTECSLRLHRATGHLDRRRAPCTPDKQRWIEHFLTTYARMVDGDDYSSADLGGNWYHRNLAPVH